MEREEKTSKLANERKNGFSSFGFKFDELALLIVLMAVLLIDWYIYSFSVFWIYLCLFALFILVILLSVLVVNINYTNRSHTFWFLGSGLLFAVAALLFEIFNRLQIINIFILLAPVAVFYLITLGSIIKDSHIAEKKSAKSVKPTEIILLCLKSKFFDSLLFLTLATSLYSLYVSRQMAASGSEEMVGVYIVFMWIFVAILFAVILFIGMAFVVRKKRKTFLAVVLFSIVTVIVLVTTLVFNFLYMIWWNNR
ncbi:MAG: hypothetical protein WCQ96_02500 [Patescibacteria group bacterium]